MNEVRIQVLQQHAKFTLLVADDEGWSEVDTTRQLAVLALEAADALKALRAELEQANGSLNEARRQLCENRAAKWRLRELLKSYAPDALDRLDAACAAIEKLNAEQADACRQTAEYWDKREFGHDGLENLCDCGMGDATMPDLHYKMCAVHRG